VQEIATQANIPGPLDRINWELPDERNRLPFKAKKLEQGLLWKPKDFNHATRVRLEKWSDIR
jgi:hypothetical protein